MVVRVLGEREEAVSVVCGIMVVTRPQSVYAL